MNMISNNKKINIFTIFLISLLYFIPTYSNAAIVTFLKPLGFIAAAIADKVTSVEVIVPDGTIIHNYSLRPLDMMKIRDADFLILIGGDAEPFFFKKIIHHFNKKNIELGSLTKIKLLLIYNCINFTDKEIKKNILHNQKEINNFSYDIHVWLSPKIALESAIEIRNMLIKIIPQKKIQIDNNLKYFKFNLCQLDKKIKKRLTFIKEKKYFIFHNAYKYFENHYNFHPIGYFEKYPGIQTGARTLYEIKKQLQKKKATCIFTEPQFNANIIDVIIRGTNVHKGLLNPLGTKIPLSKDSYLKFLLQLSDQYIHCFKKS